MSDEKIIELPILRLEIANTNVQQEQDRVMIEASGATSEEARENFDFLLDRMSIISFVRPVQPPEKKPSYLS